MTESDSPSARILAGLDGAVPRSALTPDVVRAFGSPANEARRARAATLGARRGRGASQVALAQGLSGPSAPLTAIESRDPAPA